MSPIPAAPSQRPPVDRARPKGPRHNEDDSRPTEPAALRHDRPDLLDGPLFRPLLRRAGRRRDRRDRGRRPRAGRCSCAQLPPHGRPPPRPRLEDARGGQHRRHPIDARDRGGGAERDCGRAGTPRALHVLRRERPCEQPLSPIRRGRLPEGLGDPRGRPRAARLAGRTREPRPRHPIRAFHPGIHG